MRAYHEAERALEADRPHYLYRAVLTAGLARAAQETGIDLASEDADLLVRRWGDLPLYPDVPKALDALRTAGWKIGVLTNCDNDLFATTLACNPALRPDIVITAEETGSYKQSLAIFCALNPQTGVLSNWHRRERPFGSFSRPVQLPFRVDPEQVEARFANGVLEVELHRPAADRPKKIQING